MNGKPIFAVLFFCVSALGSAQTALLPDVWITSRKLLKSILDSVSNTERIEREADRRTQLYTNFLSRKKSYVQILRDQRARIRELRTKIFETKYFIQSNKQPTSEELESELCELLNKPADLELNGIDENNLIQIMDSEPDPRVLEQPSPVVMNRPMGWTAPTQSQQSTASSSDGVPLCPISYVVMTDPVVAADGHTYDRSAIEQWFAENIASNVPVRSPMTNLVLTSHELVPNHAFKQLLELFTMRPKVSVATQTSQRTPLFSQQDHAMMKKVRTASMRDLQPSPTLPTRNVSTLEWRLTPATSNSMNFAKALDYCNSQGERWRLPTVWELFSLYQQRQVLIDADYVLDGFVWSSTKFDGVSNGGFNAVWFVSFDDATVWHSMLQFENRVLWVRQVDTVGFVLRVAMDDSEESEGSDLF